MRLTNGRWLLMGMAVLVLLFLWCASLPLVKNVWGEEPKEVLTLKRDLQAERVARIQAQMQLLSDRYALLAMELDASQRVLEELNKRLGVEPPKPAPVKPEEKKK